MKVKMEKLHTCSENAGHVQGKEAGPEGRGGQVAEAGPGREEDRAREAPSVPALPGRRGSRARGRQFRLLVCAAFLHGAHYIFMLCWRVPGVFGFLS